MILTTLIIIINHVYNQVATATPTEHFVTLLRNTTSGVTSSTSVLFHRYFVH